MFYYVYPLFDNLPQPTWRASTWHSLSSPSLVSMWDCGLLLAVQMGRCDISNIDIALNSKHIGIVRHSCGPNT